MPEIYQEYLNLMNTLKSYLSTEILSGVTEILLSEGGTTPHYVAQDLSGVLKAEDDIVPAKGISGYESKELVSEKTGQMKSLHHQVCICLKCDLHKTRTNVVFGAGNINTRLCFVGEAPGRDEDQQGKPFVGRAGQKLTDIIRAMGLSRKDVFIANVLKCRPPGNRNPQPEEVKTCWPYLKQQLEIIQPAVICTLGKFAAWTLLATETPIGQLRGKFHDWQGIKVMPTYHPAYLLRNPGAKKQVWEDIKKVMAVLDLKLPDPRP